MDEQRVLWKVAGSVDDGGGICTAFVEQSGMSPRTLLDLALGGLPTASPPRIPWDEPGFSARMLVEHLSQDHDAASRRFVTIDAHVAWIHRELLDGRPSRILDLGCGPGLYTSRLARLGHTCTGGIDISPASIAYATAEARQERLACAYRNEDIGDATYGIGFDLVMLIFGELNVFPRDAARSIVARAREALRPGGILLLEVHTEGAIRRQGQRPPSWYARERGVFSGEPHLVLQTHHWDANTKVATTTYDVVDAHSGEVTRYGEHAYAYDDGAYAALLAAGGFGHMRTVPSLRGVPDPDQPGLRVLIAER
jgi:SAM-dependent methyltransferase